MLYAGQEKKKILEPQPNLTMFRTPATLKVAGDETINSTINGQ